MDGRTDNVSMAAERPLTVDRTYRWEDDSQVKVSKQRRHTHTHPEWREVGEKMTARRWQKEEIDDDELICTRPVARWIEHSRQKSTVSDDSSYTHTADGGCGADGVEGRRLKKESQLAVCRSRIVIEILIKILISIKSKLRTANWLDCKHNNDWLAVYQNKILRPQWFKAAAEEWREEGEETRKAMIKEDDLVFSLDTHIHISLITAITTISWSSIKRTAAAEEEKLYRVDGEETMKAMCCDIDWVTKMFTRPVKTRRLVVVVVRNRTTTVQTSLDQIEMEKA